MTHQISTVVICFTLLVSGIACKIGPNQPYPAKDRFGLQADGVLPAGTSPSGSVLVERVHVAPPYDQRGFVYRTGELQYTSDYYNQFVANPDDLLTGEIIQGLIATGRFDVVLDASTSANVSYRLNTTVTRLEGDFRVAAQLKAVIALRVVLLEDAGNETRVLGESDLLEVEPIASMSAADLCRGWEKALGRGIARLSEWAHSTIPPRPATSKSE